VKWLGLYPSKFNSWKQRYGKDNFHNGKIPRDFWIEDWEKQKIIDFKKSNPLEGYRSICYMMLDQDIVSVTPSTTYRVLKEFGCLKAWNRKDSTKGKGFTQPLKPHEHWHVDISYLNICSTFYYLITVLDGCSRYVVEWDIRESMTEADVEIVIQKALEKFPGAKPRIITDNGPQFIAKDFKEFVRVSGMTHVRTSPYYPQSNGKLERYHKTIKNECIRPKSIVSYKDALKTVSNFVEHYNKKRLCGAIGYITPECRLNGKHLEVFKARDLKLQAARERRKHVRQQGVSSPTNLAA
jgi:transposase InsO family protein